MLGVDKPVESEPLRFPGVDARDACAGPRSRLAETRRGRYFSHQPCTALCNSMVDCVATCCTVLQRVVQCCNLVCCVATVDRVAKGDALFASAMRCVQLVSSPPLHPCVAMRRNALRSRLIHTHPRPVRAALMPTWAQRGCAGVL